MSQTCRTLLGSIVLLTFALVSYAAAVTLSPGDILVTDATGSGAVIRINPVTGAQTVVSSGGFFVDPTGVAVAPNGQIFVVDLNAFGGSGGILRVDPSTSAQTVVSSGGFFVNPVNVAIAPNGDILVVDLDAFGGPGGVIRVDAVTGAQAVVSSGGFFVDPFGIAIAPNSDILVADGNTFGVPPFNVVPGGAIIRVNPITGAQTIISSGGSFFDPIGIDLDAAGQILVADQNSFAGGGHVCGGGIGALFRIDPTTGAQTVVAVAGPFTIAGVAGLVAPFGRVTVEADGNILANAGNVFGQFTGVPAGGGGFCLDAPGAIFRVNPTTGAVTLLSFGGLLLSGGGMAIVPVQSPAQMTSNLTTTVTNLGFQQGVLLLQNALGKINAGNLVAACNQLSAFINQAQAQSGRQLTVGQANQLIASANQIRAALGCS